MTERVGDTIGRLAKKNVRCHKRSIIASEDRVFVTTDNGKLLLVDPTSRRGAVLDR